MKKFILWNYERGTVQYDIFCLLIVAFIFLTPKTWFDNGEKMANPAQEARVQAQDFLSEQNKTEIEAIKGRFRR